MADTHQKQRKLEPCIICGKNSPQDVLCRLKDLRSWKTLQDAAKIRFFEPITTLHVEENCLPNIHYHRECRSTFTHKKAIAKLQKQTESPVSSTQEISTTHSLRQGSSSDHSRVYDEICIFCEKKSKYVKGTHGREHLIQAVEMRADKTIRDTAIKKGDERLMAITSRDLVAAEAHYHASCYKSYTYFYKGVTLNDKSEDGYYAVTENKAMQQLFDYIRMDIVKNPRLIPLNDLTKKLGSFLHDEGMEIKDSSKKHIRRRLEKEFGKTLIFFNVGRTTYLRPSTLSTDSIACELVRHQEKLDAYTKEDHCSQLICKAALVLHDSITSDCIKEQPWPPNPKDLDNNYAEIPDCLLQFLKVLIGGEQDKGSPSDRVNRLAWSMGQDVLTAVSSGKILTPKHILLSWAVKTLTGNVELIKILNRLGHSCSYTKVEEVDTALCIEKLNSTSCEFALPSGFHIRVPTVLAFDNIDRVEETLSGSGTSHRVNGIIIQPLTLSCEPKLPKKPSVDKKEKKRSIEPSDHPLPLYISGKRASPPPLLAVDSSSQNVSDAITVAANKNLIWIIARAHAPSHQTINSWTGFNIRIRDHLTFLEDNIGYLPTINAPATNTSTVYEILCQSVAIQKQLQLETIAVVMDQALYSKACEVIWKHQIQFQDIVLMMGNFHIICNLSSIIGKMFGSAGLRDLAVESGVIAEGSIDKVLEGKQYNRAVRLHKLTYEALLRLAWLGFIDWMETNHTSDLQNFNETLHVIRDLHENVCSETFESAITNQSCQRILDLFNEYLNLLRNGCGDLAAFWMNYIDIVEIMLGLIRADREGDWNLHLESIRKMIPWCFAMDKTNYSRYLPVYYNQMSHLEQNNPELFSHFKRGGFSVQLRRTNPFGKIPIDQTLEETVNKDTQTSGGTKGFSLNKGAVARYYLTAEYRTEALRQLRELLSLQSDNKGHADLQPSRIKRDESDVESLIDMLENNWINPLSIEPRDLVSISTGVVAPSDICDDLLKARQRGEEAYITQASKLAEGIGFYEPIRRLRIKTFSDISKQTVAKGTNKEVTLRADNRLFGQILLIAQNRKLNMMEVLSYPLGPKPWALANGDGSLKKTDKSSLGRHIEKEAAYMDTISGSRAIIIDGMGIVQQVSGENITFREVSQQVLKKVLYNGEGSERIDVVFDKYMKHSIKDIEHVVRGSREGLKFNQIKASHRIRNWRRLLASSESKTKLIEYLVESWKEEDSRKLLGNTSLVANSGDQCYLITKERVTEIAELRSTQEEADTRVMIHINHAALKFDKVVIVSEDTDVFIILLGLHSDIIDTKQTRIILRRGKGNNIRFIDISRLATILGSDLCKAMVGAHAFTGCDCVSAIAGQGKIKAINLLRKNIQFKEAFMSLGMEWSVSKSMFDTMQAFTCCLYSLNTSITCVNRMRYEIFRAKQGGISSAQLPPCKDALMQHTKRANYQAAIWRRSLQRFPDVPDPTDHGWELINGNLTIRWLTLPPAPDVILSLLYCKCTRSCNAETCPCVQNGISCTPACKQQNCQNFREDEEDIDQDVEDSESEED